MPRVRVLLAGSTGAIGRYLVPQLRAAGHEVVGLSRAPEADVNVDLLDRQAVLDRLDGEHFDAVIHQATALATPPAVHAQMTRTNRLRTEGTSTLLAVARRSGAKRFVTASAFYGYGFLDHGETPLTEDEPFGLRDGSANDEVLRCLLANEQQASAFGGVSLRYGLFYGNGAAPMVDSSFEGLLPVVHLEDAAAAAVRALTRGKRGAAYNIADEQPVSWRELQAAQAVADGRRPPLALPSWALRASAPFAAELLTRTSMRLSMVRTRRDMGWRPQYPSFAEGLRPAVEVAG